MTTFKEARTFLLEHRTDYETAVAGFHWPDPVPFNWALDWFDAELATNAASCDYQALWVVETATGIETKLRADPNYRAWRSAVVQWQG